MTVFDPHKPLQKDPSENLPRSDLDPKILGIYSVSLFGDSFSNVLRM